LDFVRLNTPEENKEHSLIACLVFKEALCVPVRGSPRYEHGHRCSKPQAFIDIAKNTVWRNIPKNW